MDPLEQLRTDRGLARGQQDPNAGICTLASVDGDGLPQARTLVLRDLEDRLAIFINATSPKFEFVWQRPVSVLVWLPTLNVQYRLACATEPVADDVVAASWLLRPAPPQRMDWLYTRSHPQSTPVASREHLLDTLRGLELPEPLAAPATARGLYLNPTLVERLDLSQENGVHDRREYRLDDSGWQEQVLIP